MMPKARKMNRTRLRPFFATVAHGCLGHLFHARHGSVRSHLLMPTLMHAVGVAGARAWELLSAVPFLCTILMMNICVRRAGRQWERRWHTIIPTPARVVGFAATRLHLADTSIAATDVLTSTPLFCSLLIAFLSGCAAAGGIAIINSCGNLVGFVSPLAIGILRDRRHQDGYAIYLLSAVLLLGTVGALRISKGLVNR
jgi:hypothetical protein